MATKQSSIDYIVDQITNAGEVSARKMFGEYALYCDRKVVALVCDDALYVKITDQGKAFVGSSYKEGHAYKGAKASMLINEDKIEDRQWITELIRITTDNLPPPKPKKKKTE